MQTDAEIVQAVLRGDREAFAALVVRYERAAWTTAWRILRDDHAAADATQEAFLQAFHRLDGLRCPDQFGVWLLQIARRESIRLSRRRARNPVRSLDATGTDRVDSPATQLSDDAEELLAAVATLPEHERIVVVLHYLNGCSVVEVAAALGRPVGTVTKQLSRAIGRLKVKAKGVVG